MLYPEKLISDPDHFYNRGAKIKPEQIKKMYSASFYHEMFFNFS
jgi:hypothetical protein